MVTLSQVRESPQLRSFVSAVDSIAYTCMRQVNHRSRGRLRFFVDAKDKADKREFPGLPLRFECDVDTGARILETLTVVFSPKPMEWRDRTEPYDPSLHGFVSAVEVAVYRATLQPRYQLYALETQSTFFPPAGPFPGEFYRYPGFTTYDTVRRDGGIISTLGMNETQIRERLRALGTRDIRAARIGFDVAGGVIPLRCPGTDLYGPLRVKIDDRPGGFHTFEGSERAIDGVMDYLSKMFDLPAYPIHVPQVQSDTPEHPETFGSKVLRFLQMDAVELFKKVVRKITG